MTISAGIHALLLADVTLDAIVGNRIYEVALPQARTYPAVSHFMVDGTRTPLMSANSGIVQGRWQVDIWSQKIATLRTAAAAVRGTLNRVTGTSAGTVILYCLLDDEGDMPFERDTELFHATQDYILKWRE